jgi:S-adenosylmethionine-diacylglycerol 3-amino-3-carboxypropyl transferase
VLGRAGLDPTFFTYVSGIDDFGEHFRRRARQALVELPTEDNYFLAQICLGRFLNEKALPPYLQAENYEKLRETVGCIEIVTGELSQILAGEPADSIDAFNLSNVFEWVSETNFERLLKQIHRVARNEARLCYRNLLVRRRTPDHLHNLFRPYPVLGDRLLAQDRSFVYSHFEVASVHKDGVGRAISESDPLESCLTRGQP